MYGCVFHKEDGFCEKFSDDRCKSYCVMGPCQYAIPSNADRIRGMTDEELAQTLYWLRLDALRLEGFEGQIETTDEILEWLKATYVPVFRSFLHLQGVQDKT